MVVEFFTDEISNDLIFEISPIWSEVCFLK